MPVKELTASLKEADQSVRDQLECIGAEPQNGVTQGSAAASSHRAGRAGRLGRVGKDGQLTDSHAQEECHSNRTDKPGKGLNQVSRGDGKEDTDVHGGGGGGRGWGSAGRNKCPRECQIRAVEVRIKS
ncbi:hypothetical protein HJG60_008555 [Phyllostomus discolor]|uniref:Uncharacterized protein n=1 Tax=Phyllostomus discolor TaxID=89673 RepID=A0A833Z182_9CHIR|nr:hypothetical protein HJG60_008555 [Phyllostomus discolor]